jgi:hypothetical protein
VRVERTAHAHLTTEADSKGWDDEPVRATVYVLFCCTDFGRAKIRYTHAGSAGVRRRLAYMRRKRELPDLDTIGTVDLGTDVEGWAREEAIRLWLVHRQKFRWDPWQDWLVVPKGLDGVEVVRLLIEARDAVYQWLGIERPDAQQLAPSEPSALLPGHDPVRASA